MSINDNTDKSNSLTGRMMLHIPSHIKNRIDIMRPLDLEEPSLQKLVEKKATINIHLVALSEQDFILLVLNSPSAR